MIQQARLQYRSKVLWRKRIYSDILTIAMLTCIIVFGKYRYLLDVKTFPIYLISGIVAGALLFFLSVVIHNAFTMKKAVELFSDAVFLPAFITNHKMVVLKYIGVAVVEELFWRALVQETLFNGIVQVLIVTFIFTAVHFIKKEIYVYSLLEFYIFFLILSYLFMMTQSIYLVITIHFIRNILITFISFIQRVKGGRIYDLE